MSKKRNFSHLSVLHFVIPVSVLLVISSIFLPGTPQLRQTVLSTSSITEGPTNRSVEGKTTEFSLADNDADFPIANPQVGSVVMQCNGKNNSNPEWQIRQWNNSSSLCNDSTGQGQTALKKCAGATAIRSTSTSRYCYWQDHKKFDLSVNTANMKNQGCYVNDNPLNLANTGGYSAYITWDPTTRADYWKSNIYTLGNLQSLIVSTGFENNYFASKACPANLVDPVIKTNAPIGFTYISVTAQEADPKTKTFKNAIFYQAVTYDNRSEKVKPDSLHLDCKKSLSSTVTTSIVASEPVTALDMPIAYPTNQSKDGGEREYRINMLPQILKYLTQCGMKADLTKYKVTSVYVGSESYNGVNITSYVTDPRVSLVTK